MTPVGAASCGGERELFSEVLRVQQKTFYVDLKENARGKYIKVAERGRYRPKSSIVLPVTGLAQFLVMIDYYMQEAADGRVGQPRDVIIESKVFNFSAGDNERGKYLRIYESGGGYPAGGSSLMIPAGWSNTYLSLFRGCMERVAEQLAEDGITGLDLQGASSIAAIATPVTPGSDTVHLDKTKEGGPVLSIGNKHFFFELRSNERGQYLKVKEVSGNMKNLLVIPTNAVLKFQEAISLALMQTPRVDQQVQQQQQQPPPPPHHQGNQVAPQMQGQLHGHHAGLGNHNALPMKGMGMVGGPNGVMSAMPNGVMAGPGGLHHM